MFYVIQWRIVAIGFNDAARSHGARSYTNFARSDFETNANNLYLDGGETALVEALRHDAELNGAKFYIDKGITCISESKRNSVQFELQTEDGDLVLVSEFMIMNTNGYYLKEGNQYYTTESYFSNEFFYILCNMMA